MSLSGSCAASDRIQTDPLPVPALATLNEVVISLTYKGAEKVNESLASQQEPAPTAGLRVGVRGGGCSGFQYQLAFDTERDGDIVFESHGLKLLVDREGVALVRVCAIE